MSEPPQPEPRVLRRRLPGKALPKVTWVLVAIILFGFSLGVLLVLTGFLGDGSVDLPGPTAFTLTPQATETSFPGS